MPEIFWPAVIVSVIASFGLSGCIQVICHGERAEVRTHRPAPLDVKSASEK